MVAQTLVFILTPAITQQPPLLFLQREPHCSSSRLIEVVRGYCHPRKFCVQRPWGLQSTLHLYLVKQAHPDLKNSNDASNDASNAPQGTRGKPRFMLGLRYPAFALLSSQFVIPVASNQSLPMLILLRSTLSSISLAGRVQTNVVPWKFPGFFLLFSGKVLDEVWGRTEPMEHDHNILEDLWSELVAGILRHDS